MNLGGNMCLGFAIEKNTTARWGLTGTIIWSVVIALVFVITQIFAIGIYIGLFYGKVAANDLAGLVSTLKNNGYVVSLCSITTFVICGGLIAGIIKLKKGTRIKDYLGLHSVNAKTLFFWILISLLYIASSDTLTFALGRPIVPDYVVAVYSSIKNVWVLWLALLVTGPIFEEVFFRGFLFSGLSSSFIRPLGAIILSSIAWASIHMQYDLFVIALIFGQGLIFGAARFASGSILLTIALHSLTNLVATVETVLKIAN
jgi:uncharacterized protein